MFIEPHFVATNGIRMAVYEEGEGAPVIFLHGFPELAFSWRHQLPALAEAGFRAIAPDLRGYGQTGGPDAVEDYRLTELVGDVLGLMDALELETATLVGHDWGALLMWHLAMHSPQRVERLIGLNIPHTPRPPADPIALFRKRFGDDFYIVNFQDSDEADRTFAANPQKFFTYLMRKNQMPRAVFDQLPDEMKVLSLVNLMHRDDVSGDPVLTAEELDYFVKAFEHSGFTKPINWYRNWSRNWRDFADLSDVINIPTLFIAAADELVVGPEHVAAMRAVIPGVQIETLSPCGHWSQQEHPNQVNKLILDWLLNA